MHWATPLHYLCLSRAATFASSQVNPVICRSLLTVLRQFALGRPGPLLYPGTCQYSACCGMHWWSIRKTCPSQRSHLSLSMLSMVCYPVLALTSTAVILSFQEMASCSSAVCGAQHLVFSLILLSTVIYYYKSALYRRFDRMLLHTTSSSPAGQHYCCSQSSLF